MEALRNKRFLIVKPSSLGDILHAFPAVAALRRAYPDAVLDWVINPAFEGLLDYMPGIEHRILFRRKELGSLKTFFPAFSGCPQNVFINTPENIFRSMFKYILVSIIPASFLFAYILISIKWHLSGTFGYLYEYAGIQLRSPTADLYLSS